MTSPPSSLRDLLDRALRPGGETELLDVVGDRSVATVDDARALAEAAGRLRADLEKAGGAGKVPLHGLIGLFQSIETREAFDVLRAEGVPHLLAIHDARLGAAGPGESSPEELLFLLKVAAMYRVEEVVDRLVAAARRPIGPSSYLWSVIFSAFDEDHPYRDRILRALRDPLPGGFIGVAYLDLANAVLRGGHPSSHPFDTAEGRARLRSYLTDPSEPGRARSAAAALPFIGRPERDELLGLAMDYPDSDVQLEAAWAAGRLGDESALRFLERACLDHRTARAASRYLSELGRSNRVPAAACDPNFRALSEMVEWLAHPSEFGRAPDVVEIVDTRELNWPPTTDRRRLWLVRYRYGPDTPGGQAEEGVGIVGSVTFALFGEATAQLSPEDLYALYCCWELEVRGAAEAPPVRSVAAGRAVLRRGRNEGF